MTKIFTTVGPYHFAKLALSVIMPFITNVDLSFVWNFEFGLLGFVWNLVFGAWNFHDLH